MTAGLATFVNAHGRALVLIVLCFALAGIVLAPQIPVSIFPQTDFPRIVILVDNGISPPNIQMTTVTRPIEEAIRLVPGVTTVRSTTARGSPRTSISKWASANRTVSLAVFKRCFCRAVSILAK